MATYKGIRGLTIRTIDGDASPIIAGDIWYNSTLGKIKGAKLPAGAWASGGNLNNAKWKMAGAGIQTAAIIAGGQRPPGSVVEAETYDGSSWTEVGDINTARRGLPGVGTQTAAMIIGGFPGAKTEVEQYDGSSWTEVADLTVGRQWGAAAGTQTAALYWSGYTHPAAQTATAELWNGASWTEVGDLNQARYYARACCGTSTAALQIGGWSTPPSTQQPLVEEWNGSTWTEIADISTVREMAVGAGITTAALVAAGYSGGSNTANTEQFDGTAWAEVANLATARVQHGTASAAPNTLALVMGGDPATNVTEEWTQEVEAVTFTSS